MQILDSCDGYDGLDGSDAGDDCDGCCPIDKQPLQLTRIEDFRVNRSLVDVLEASRSEVADDFKLHEGQLEYYTDRVLGRGRSGKVFASAQSLQPVLHGSYSCGAKSTISHPCVTPKPAMPMRHAKIGAGHAAAEAAPWRLEIC